MVAQLKMKKVRLPGFTLIELLIVIGILAILLSIVLIAVNPFEQINKSVDVTSSTVASDFVSAINYYYTDQKTFPWVNDPTCLTELATAQTLSDIPSCINDLTGGGSLQSSYLSSQSTSKVFVTECSNAVALCYNPQSQQFNENSDTKYTKNGVLEPGCPSSNGISKNCYACTFSTNDAQECFQALNPNGTLAIVPSPSPDQPLQITSRQTKNTCDSPNSGNVACMAKVVTDSSGNPLSSIALTGGYGPTQIHIAYNLPCTPGGSVQSVCPQPTTFGPQTIAIVDAYNDPTVANDLTTYSQTYNLPSCTTTNGCFTVVNQNGQTSPLPVTDADWALEESLDVQMAHAVCQTCKILLVEASSSDFSDIATAENEAAQLGATAISNSYGAPDFSGETAYDSYYNHQGVYVTASSGDWGYGAYYPAASKDVIAVGGTTLSLYPNYSYASESVWGLSGSGCSLYEMANSFQTNLSDWNLTGCGTERSIADVSADADPDTGVSVYDSTPYGNSSGWWILGGTSVSSPVVASALTLTGNAPSNVPSAYYIYLNPSKFRDVTSGSDGSCGGKTSCTAAVGYDGPSGMGSPNIAPPAQSTSPNPTQAPLNCSQNQTVTLNQTNPISALPGDTVYNTLTVTSNDSPGCSSLYTISQGVPTGWTVSGIPPSFTLAGGGTEIIPFSMQVPSTATAGNYGYQFWVAKQGQSSTNPVDGSVQVQQVGPTNTPTPTPIVCSNPWSQSLGNTTLSGNAGDTLNQTLTITNNNSSACGSAVFTISYSEPAGFVTNSLPPSVTLAGGQSTTIPFTITISTGAQVQSYETQYWIDSGSNPLNTTINVTGTTSPPAQQMFSNFSTRPYGTYALFMFSYNMNGTSDFRLDVATNPSALNQTVGPNSTAYYGWAYTTGNAMDASNNATPASTRGFIVSSPQSWSGWKCGSTIYYRMYNDGDLAIASPIESTTVDCSTVVNVLPWAGWYTAIYQGIYNPVYDANHDGVVNWVDYWILVIATQLR